MNNLSYIKHVLTSINWSLSFFEIFTCVEHLTVSTDQHIIKKKSIELVRLDYAMEKTFAND